MLLVLLLLFSASTGDGADWPGWRGDGSGVAVGSNLPEHWSTNENTWRTYIKGEGHSSPVVIGDRVFLTAAFESGRYAAAPLVFLVLGLVVVVGAMFKLVWRGWQTTFVPD